MKIDTGADVNALNRRTFQELFPNVQLNPSTVVLENFDKTLIRSMGSFKCFLRWKGNVYRCAVRVMDNNDALSRETTFLMGILKPCFIISKKSAEGGKVFSDAKNAISLHPDNLPPGVSVLSLQTTEKSIGKVHMGSKHVSPVEKHGKHSQQCLQTSQSADLVSV